MIDKLTAIYSRYEQLEEQLGNPDLVSDLSRYKKLNKFSVPNAPREATAKDRKKVSKRAKSNKRVINKKKSVDCSVNNVFTIISSAGTSLTGFNLSNGFSETCFTDSL